MMLTKAAQPVVAVEIVLETVAFQVFDQMPHFLLILYITIWFEIMLFV